MSTESRLRGQTALITGAARRVGAEIVRTAAEHMVSKDAVAVERAIFKGGEFRMSIGVKGFELSPAMYTKIQGMKQLATVGSEVES